jgi:hypothetical protein
MWRHVCGMSLLAFLASCVSGCSLVQPPDSVVSTEDRPPHGVQPVATMDVFLFNDQGPLPKIDPQELKPGQHVQLLTGENLSGDFLDEVEMCTRSFAGTVKANDGDRLVLQDFVMIHEARSQTGVPVLSKIPYVSRLFKSTGAGRKGISIPGEVALERSKILHACELTDESFKTIRQNGGYERIGVDFDFNVAEGVSPAS